MKKVSVGACTFKVKSQTWYLGDIHLGHKLVAATRGFFNADGTVDVEGHDRAVLQSILDNVNPGDTLRLLGDNSANNTWEYALDAVAGLRTHIPGLKIELIYGNHDATHMQRKGIDHDVFRSFADVYDWMGERAVVKLWGRTLYMSHYPTFHGDDPRHTPSKDDKWRWNPSLMEHPNAWTVHAHTHQHTLTTPDRERHVCVSWDVLRKPLSENALKRIVLNQERQHVLTRAVGWGSLEENRELALRVSRREVRV